MMSYPSLLDDRFIRSLKIFSQAASAFVMLVGALVLTSWLFNIDGSRGVYAHITMKANAALGLLLAGASLWALSLDDKSAFARRAGQLCAAVVALIGVLTLSQHLFGWNLGLDVLLFTEPAGALATASPGRMGLPASTCFILSGTALLLLHASRAILLAQLLSTVAALWAMLAIIGYIYGADKLYSIAGYTGIAFHTAVALFALSLGLLAVRADRGIISVISSDRAGGLMARRLLTAAIGVPFLLGWLHHKAQQSGYYDLAFGTALLILAIIVIFTAIIWQSAAKLNYIEQQHLSAEERFRLAVESAPNAMVMTDEEGRIVLVNSQVERVFGYTREELMGQPIEMLVPERFRRQHRDYRAEFANDPQTRPMAAGRDLFGLRKDGSEVPIEIGLNPIKVKGHTLTLSSIMDITERKRVEQTLADHLHELETVMEVLPVGLLIAHDREGTRIVGNRAAREFLRIGSGADSNISLTAPPGEAPTHMNVLKDGQEIPPEELPVQRAASQGIAVHNLELEVVFDDGEVKHELLNALPLFDQNGVPRGAVASLVDITDRKQIEADLRRANQLKDEFLATVSHELRTPLNAILGWATLLRRGILDEATVDRALETIERNAQAQAQLIEDLLDVSRIIAGKLRLDVKPIDLTSVIKAAIDSVQHAADARGIQLQMVLDPAASRTRGDAARLQQVVWNLLSNSIKFTPEGGLVQVRLDRAGSQTQITVTDTGEGINPEFLPYVFDRFQQADMSKTRRQGGLGLGLAIVRHIVELHGGAVEARSPGSGKGASFTVRLPLAAERVTGALPALPAEGASREVKSIIPESRLLHGLRILAVDDEPDTRGMVKGVLEQYGADVMTAASVRDAFDAVPGFRPDVLVCDIGMPEEDGYSFIHKVRELQPEQGGNTPAIALTGYVRVEERARALEAGFQMFVPKPVEADELASMIANLVGRMDEI